MNHIDFTSFPKLEFFLLLIFENFWNCANFYWTFFLWFFFNFRTTNLVKCQRLIFNQICKKNSTSKKFKLNSFCQSIRDTVLERRLISNMYYESKDKEPQSEKISQIFMYCLRNTWSFVKFLHKVVIKMNWFDFS